MAAMVRYVSLFSISVILSMLSMSLAARCFVCAHADSDENCNSKNVTCQASDNEICLSSYRQESRSFYLYKSCLQRSACKNLELQNNFLCNTERDDLVCFQCCSEDLCNQNVRWPMLKKDISLPLPVRNNNNVSVWIKNLSKKSSLNSTIAQRKLRQKKRRRRYRRRKVVRQAKKNASSINLEAKRLQSLVQRPVYVEDDVSRSNVVLFSSELSDMSKASVMMMSAAPPSCGVPSLLGISFVKLGSWPTGASFVIVASKTNTATQGWAILIAFSQPLPSSCTFTTWVAQIFQEDISRKAFILENQPYNIDISMFSEFNVTFNLQNCPIGFTSTLNAGVAAFYDVPLSKGQCVRQSSIPLTTASTSTTTTTPVTTASTSTTTTTPVTTASTSTTTTTPAASSTISTTITTTTSAIFATTSTIAPTLSASTAGATTTTLTTATVTTVASQNCIQQSSSAFTLLGPAFPGYQSDVRSHVRINMTSLQNVRHNSWVIKLVFNFPLKSILAWQVVISGTGNGTVFLVKPQPWYNVLQDLRSFDILVSYNVPGVPMASVFYCNNGSGVSYSQPPNTAFPPPSSSTPTVSLAPTSTTGVTTTPSQNCAGLRSLLPPVSKEALVNFVPSSPSDNLLYDYNEVLHKSLLFYEAQRSGKLPLNNRVYWRGDSNLHDGCDVGVDLTGGWDVEENVKYGFPVAATVTLLAWGMIEFEEGYRDSQEWSNALENLKWGADYIVKTHTAPNTLWGQVGVPVQNLWTRPEELTTVRTTYQLNETFPGSELAGESAAALAAAAIVFKYDQPYSNMLLQHAIQLYNFADRYREFYDTSMPIAGRVYPSLSGYSDELVWAALWLFKATGIATYFDDANRKRVEFNLFKRPFDFSWDNKLAGIQMLLANITGNNTDRGDIENFLNHCITGSSVPRTPGGLAYFSNFGTNAYAANAAFIALVSSKLVPPLPNQQRYKDFAVAQIHAMLGSGDGGRSYVVGFGNNSPTQPYHAASSCPQWSSPPPVCGQSALNSADANPHILYGALVGGPDQNGNYNPNRKEFANNEVSIYNNAGFQSAVAGLKYFVKVARTP